MIAEILISKSKNNFSFCKPSVPFYVPWYMLPIHREMFHHGLLGMAERANGDSELPVLRKFI